MRGYVPQRHTFALMWSLISARVGRGFAASSAAALISWPDWQEPHCGTLSASHAFCRAFMRLGERPSMVVTALPCAADTGIRQENMRSPSMCTMQARHWRAPQPNFVPVSFSSSRSTHKRRVLSGALTLTGLPLTVKLIAISTPFWFATMLLPAQNRGQCCAATNRVSVAPVPCLWRRTVWVSVRLAARPRSSLAANLLQLVPGRTLNLPIRQAPLPAARAPPLAPSAAEYTHETPSQ